MFYFNLSFIISAVKGVFHGLIVFWEGVKQVIDCQCIDEYGLLTDLF